MRDLLFLGTAGGNPIQSSSTSILVEDDKNNLLIDAAGGGDLILRLHEAKRNPLEITNVFISHCDSDHILGIVSLFRRFKLQNKKRNIFCSKYTKTAINSLFKYIAKYHYQKVKKNLNFIIVKDKSRYKIGKWSLQFFDIKPKKTPQMGCIINFPDNKKLVFLGDEPLKEHYFNIVKNSDILIHNAFSSEKEEKIFKSHEKGHSTVKDAAISAKKLNAKSLLLYHMQDKKDLKSRRKRYTKEAKNYFKGRVFVPYDLDKYKF
jgi:ribonuclease Z